MEQKSTPNIEAAIDGQENKKQTSVKKEILSWVVALGSAVVLVLLVNAFVAKTVIVQSVSMNDTLVANDRLVVTKLFSDISAGDIVVFHSTDTKDFIKRVIAVGGDTVDINFETGEVYVNNEVIDEPYIKEKTREQLDFKGPVTVLPGHIFVMGDNRNHSNDSRDSQVGMIPTDKVFGKVVFRFYPFNKIGTVK